MNTYTVEHLNTDLYYHDLPGHAPALVFIHGLGSASSSTFPRVVVHPRLRDQRAILIDLLGYGYSGRPIGFSYTMESQAEIVVALLAALDVADSVLIGHSMGGSIAILIAAAAPDRIGRLVVAEGNLDPGPGDVSGHVTSMAEAEFAEHGHAEFVNDVRTAGFTDYAGTVRACDPIAMHRSSVSLIAPRSPTYREQLGGLKIPRTFLFGERNVPHPDVDRLTADGISVRVIANAGHDMQGDNPDGFAEAVADAMAAQS